MPLKGPILSLTAFKGPCCPVTNSPVLKLLFDDGNERGAPAPIIAKTALHHDANFTDLFSSALRVMRDGAKLIRLSPHFYNTDAELDRLLEAL